MKNTIYTDLRGRRYPDLKGLVSKDQVHMHIEYRPSYDISSIVKLINERSLRKLQMEFPELKKDIWVVIFRLLVLDVGVQKILQMK